MFILCSCFFFSICFLFCLGPVHCLEVPIAEFHHIGQTLRQQLLHLSFPLTLFIFRDRHHTEIFVTISCWRLRVLIAPFFFILFARECHLFTFPEVLTMFPYYCFHNLGNGTVLVMVFEMAIPLLYLFWVMKAQAVTTQCVAWYEVKQQNTLFFVDR